jgi:hypothetical protein
VGDIEEAAYLVEPELQAVGYLHDAQDVCYLCFPHVHDDYDVL